MRAALLLVVLLLAGCGVPGAPPGLTVTDGLKKLDRARLESVAAPLVGRGASVHIVLAPHADGKTLTSQGLGAPNFVGVCVGMEPRFSEIRVGSRWGETVSLDSVRVNTLNPALQSGQLQQGIEGTLQAVESQLATDAFRTKLLLGLIPTGLACAALWAFFWRKCYQYPKSPPARLAFWLWDRTPWERAAIRERERQAAVRLEDEVKHLQSVRDGMQNPVPPDLVKRLNAFDASPSRTEACLLREALYAVERTHAGKRRLREILDLLEKPAGKKSKEKVSPEGRAEAARLRAELETGPIDELLEEALTLWARELPANFTRAHPQSTNYTPEPGSSYTPPPPDPPSSSSYDPTSYSSGSESSSSGSW